MHVTVRCARCELQLGLMYASLDALLQQATLILKRRKLD